MSVFITKREKEIAFKVGEFVCMQYQINIQDLISKSRSQHFAKPRFIVWHILHSNYKMSFSVIGRLYKRDHSSVMNGIKRVEILGLKNEIKIPKKLLSTYPQT